MSNPPRDGIVQRVLRPAPGCYALGMRYTASVTSEGKLVVAQCLEVDVASQGATEDEALANLREALELYLEDPPNSAHAPKIRHLDLPEARA